MADVEMTDVESGKKGGRELPPEPETGKGFLKPVPEITPTEMIVGLGAFIAVVMGIIGMIVSGGLAVPGGILSLLIGPYAYYQQTLLTDIRTLKQTEHAIEKEVDALAAENENLSKNIADMTESINRLEDIDDALDQITSMQGQSIDAFKQQVEENRRLLSMQRDNVQANVLMNILSVIQKSDADGDMIIDAEEVNTLLNRLSKVAGVAIDEAKFREKVTGQNYSAVLDVVKNLLRDDIPPEEKIFSVEPQ